MATDTTFKQDPNTPRYEKNSGLLTDYGKSLGLKEINLPTTINSSNLGQTTETNLPTETTTNYGPLDAKITASVSNADTASKAQQDLIEFRKAQDLQNQKVQSLMTDVGQEGAKIKQEAIAQGAYKDKEAYDEYVNQIRAEDLALLQTTNRLQENMTGMLASGQAGQINDATRKTMLNKATLAIYQEAAGQRYDRAMAIAKDKVEIELAPKKAELEALKYVIENNKSYDTAEFNSILSSKKSEIDREQKKLDDIENIKIQAIKGGLKNTDSLSNVKTVDEALKIAAPYLAENTIVKLENGNTIMVDGQGKQVASFGGAKTEGSNTYAITSGILKDTYSNDLVSTISNTIKNSGAKQSQSTNDAINVISGLQLLAKDNPDGVFEGLNPLIRLPNKLSSPEALTNRSNIEAINLKVQQWASGAALTEAQTKKVEKMTPSINDTDKQVRSKVNALANYMVSQVSGQLAGQGVNFSVDQVDMFAKSPEDELAEKYKDPEMKNKIQKAIAEYPTYSASEILQIIE